jgi:hypothetical protein
MKSVAIILSSVLLPLLFLSDAAIAPTVDLTPDTEALTKAITCGGALSDENTDNGVVRCVREQDQAGASTDLVVDSQNIDVGTQFSGTFPGDVTSSNNVYITYREANTGGGGAIGFDAQTESIATSYSHTIGGGANRLLVFGSATENADVTAVTYNGVALTFLAVANQAEADAEFWYMRQAQLPAAGTYTLAITKGAGVISSGVSTWTGVHQTTTFGTVGTATGTTTAITQNIVSVADDVVHDAIASKDATARCVPGAGQTTRWDLLATDVDGCGSSEVAVGTSTTMSWTSTGHVGWASVGVAIKPAGGATNYELRVRYNWATETCTDTRRLRVEGHHTTGEDFNVQTVDSTEVTWTTRFTITATADPNAYQMFDIDTDTWDSGNPNVRFLGGTESGDTTQNDLILDHVQFLCVPATDFELEYRVGWTAETCADTRRLTVNAWRVNGAMENVDVQVLDSTETTYITRLTIAATADGTTQTYDLTVDEWDSGTPDIRYLGTMESGDANQGDLNIDLGIIVCVSPDVVCEAEVSVTVRRVVDDEGWFLFVIMAAMILLFIGISRGD